MRRVATAAALIAGLALVAVLVLTAVGVSSGGRLVEVATRSGFGPVDVREDGRTRWLEADAGRLAVTVRARPRRVVLTLELSAFAAARRVTLSLEGRAVGGGGVPPGRFVTLTAPLGDLPPGRHEVVVTAVPGPQSIAGTVGVPDPRLVSVRLRGLAVREVPR